MSAVTTSVHVTLTTRYVLITDTVSVGIVTVIRLLMVILSSTICTMCNIQFLHVS